MNQQKCFLKHGLFILTYLLLAGIECYFIRSVKILYSPYLFLGILLSLGLVLNFVFLMLFKDSKSVLLSFSLYQLVQASLAFLLAFFLFHLSWKQSLVYSAGAILALLSFALIRLDFSLKNILITLFLAAGFTLALRLSGVSGGLLFALAVLNGFYLGSRLLSVDSIQQNLWENLALFTGVLALGRACIQYYLVTTGYDNLGVVITHPYTFVALFAGVFVPLVYHLILKDRLLGLITSFLILGIFFPWILGVFVHVRPFAGYLLGYVVSVFMVGLLFSGPRSLVLLSYFNFASGVFGLTLFALLSNLSRGIRLGILAGLFILTTLIYVIQSLITKNKS